MENGKHTAGRERQGKRQNGLQRMSGRRQLCPAELDRPRDWTNADQRRTRTDLGRGEERLTHISAAERHLLRSSPQPQPQTLCLQSPLRSWRRSIDHPRSVCSLRHTPQLRVQQGGTLGQILYQVAPAEIRWRRHMHRTMLLSARGWAVPPLGPRSLGSRLSTHGHSSEPQFDPSQPRRRPEFGRRSAL